MPRRRVPVAVLGATGYAGVELLRLLVRHPDVEIVSLSSEQYRERRASEVYPFLSGIIDLPLAAPEAWRESTAEIVFSALPHGASAPHVRDVVADGRRALDMSADFRLRDPAVYARWYGPHAAPELLGEAVYGIPELYRDALRGARLVAVPGCYPTGALLGLAPLARARLVREPVVLDAKSGTTGAGRSLKVDQLFAEVNENCRPYAIGAHRHQPEIDQELRRAGAGASCLFVPHLLPVSRGILSTMYVPMEERGATRAAVRRCVRRGRSSCCAARPRRAARYRHQSLCHRLALGRDHGPRGRGDGVDNLGKARLGRRCSA